MLIPLLSNLSPSPFFYHSLSPSSFLVSHLDCIHSASLLPLASSLAPQEQGRALPSRSLVSLLQSSHTHTFNNYSLIYSCMIFSKRTLILFSYLLTFSLLSPLFVLLEFAFILSRPVTLHSLGSSPSTRSNSQTPPVHFSGWRLPLCRVLPAPLSATLSHWQKIYWHSLLAKTCTCTWFIHLMIRQSIKLVATEALIFCLEIYIKFVRCYICMPSHVLRPRVSWQESKWTL